MKKMRVCLIERVLEFRVLENQTEREKDNDIEAE